MGAFRKLLRYYRHCIRSEEGADALAYQNQLGERFLYLRRSGSWLPRPGLPWRMSIPLGPHLAPFVGALPAPQAEETLVLGYPVWAFSRRRLESRMFRWYARFFIFRWSTP